MLGKREQWEGDFSASVPGMDGARIFVLQPGLYSHGDFSHIPRHFNFLDSPLNSFTAPPACVVRPRWTFPGESHLPSWM